MGTSGYLQSERRRHWVLLGADVFDGPADPKEFRELGGQAMAALMKNERLSEVAVFSEGSLNDGPVRIMFTGVVVASGLWGAMTVAAQEYFPIFEEIFGSGPSWNEAKIKELRAHCWTSNGDETECELCGLSESDERCAGGVDMNTIPCSKKKECHCITGEYGEVIDNRYCDLHDND